MYSTNASEILLAHTNQCYICHLIKNGNLIRFSSLPTVIDGESVSGQESGDMSSEEEDDERGEQGRVETKDGIMVGGNIR